MALKRVRKHLANVAGWSTHRRIVVIESDDWGSTRIPSGGVLDQLTGYGIRPCDEDEARYLHNDHLASERDLSLLFEVLGSARDSHGRPAVFTALTIVANPDFERIRDHHFRSYFYEPFTDTLKGLPGHEGSFELWKKGMSERLFVPQFHGREHLNVRVWLKALQQGHPDTIFAFDHQVYGFTPREPVSRVYYPDAFDFEKTEELDYQKTVIIEGLDLFEKLFGTRARFFVPTGGPFNNFLGGVLFDGGIQYIGVSKIQIEPLGDGRVRKRFHYLGQQTRSGQTCLTRNCYFEPSSGLKSDWVSSCLDDIAVAFKWRKPAVISSHRVNYIGSIHPGNRDSGLRQLARLLKQICRCWPDVEFMSSDELGELIRKRH
jgi:hypothetical protein